MLEYFSGSLFGYSCISESEPYAFTGVSVSIRFFVRSPMQNEYAPYTETINGS
mgnify:FL=1